MREIYSTFAQQKCLELLILAKKFSMLNPWKFKKKDGFLKYVIRKYSLFFYIKNKRFKN